jgi:hypothetical protein
MTNREGAPEHLRIVQMFDVLMDGWRYRDDACNRLEVDWGKPDDDGLFSPTVHVDSSDNPLAAARAEIERPRDDVCHQKDRADEAERVTRMANDAITAMGHAVAGAEARSDKASPVKCPDCDGLKTWCPFDFRNDREPGGFCWLARRAGGDHV